MVAHMLKLHGKVVGLTTTDGIYIDGELYKAGRHHRSVERAHGLAKS